MRMPQEFGDISHPVAGELYLKLPAAQLQSTGDGSYPPLPGRKFGMGRHSQYASERNDMPVTFAGLTPSLGIESQETSFQPIPFDLGKHFEAAILLRVNQGHHGHAAQFHSGGG